MTDLATRVTVGLPPHGGSGLKYCLTVKHVPDLRLPPHGGSGLKCLHRAPLRLPFCLPPHGGSGLKYAGQTHPAACKCLPPHGGSGLKSSRFIIRTSAYCLPPHGGSGLKWSSCKTYKRISRSPSTRREWIEIGLTFTTLDEVTSPSTRREWIEMLYNTQNTREDASLPPHGGSGLKSNAGCCIKPGNMSPSTRREWIEIACSGVKLHATGSPSTRREWIEIMRSARLLAAFCGLPPHGGSGLKYIDAAILGGCPMSPSTRREWIEI